MKHLHALAPMVLISCAALFAACGGDDPKPGDKDNAGDTSTTAGPGSGQGGGAGVGGAGAGGGTPVTPQRATISGDATWSVTFDAAAKMAGLADCSYTRHYEGVEDRSAPWVCPSCETIFRAKVEMTVGKTDCFKTFSPDEPPTDEWIGYGNGVFYRGAALASDQGTADVSNDSITVANSVPDLDVPAGGKMAFDVAGTFSLAKEDGDVLNGFVPPATYACGWPKADPPPYTGNYAVAKGATLPDGVFKDSCSEAVRLHDFKGSYLLVEMSARDCPPCQQMASEEEQFIADMKAKGIDVHVITLLCPSLTDTISETTKPMLDQWIKNYTLTSPVLGDRVWGISMFLPLSTDGSLAYPSWVLVGKELQILDVGVGFPGFPAFATTIEADAK